MTAQHCVTLSHPVTCHEAVNDLCSSDNRLGCKSVFNIESPVSIQVYILLSRRLSVTDQVRPSVEGARCTHSQPRPGVHTVTEPESGTHSTTQQSSATSGVQDRREWDDDFRGREISEIRSEC